MQRTRPIEGSLSFESHLPYTAMYKFIFSIRTTNTVIRAVYRKYRFRRKISHNTKRGVTVHVCISEYM